MTREIQITIRQSAWSSALPSVEAITHRAVMATLDSAPDLTAGLSAAAHVGAIELGVMLADDGFVRALNRDYRGRDEATNVLAFAARETGANARPAPAPDDMPCQLGDVVIALETLQREAGQADLPLAHHLSHLVVHGVLHLLGHDHADPVGERAMRAIERAVLKELGIADPYVNLSSDDTVPV